VVAATGPNLEGVDRPLPPLPEDLARRLQDAAHVTVGFGVLAFQQAQVRRRELERLVGRVCRDLRARAATPPG
jgi:hypothetical protein